MKSKIEPLLSALNEINNGLTCYNLLNLIRENGDLSNSVFFPSNVFAWTHEIFQKIPTPRFSDAGPNKKIVQMNVCKFLSNFDKLIHTLIDNVISILLGNNFNFIIFYSSIFMKSKIEPLLSALNEINNGLTCYNLLNLIRENGDLSNSVFFPSNVFAWTHEIFQKIPTPRFSDAGPNKKIVQMNVCKFFLDMVECIFMDGKCMIELILNQKT